MADRNVQDLFEKAVDSYMADITGWWAAPGFTVYNRNLHKNFIISIIILLSCSMIIYITAWILSFIFTKRYMELLNNAKN